MKLYLDQMFRVDLTQRLRTEGHDVLRAPTTNANALRLLVPFLAVHEEEEFRNHLIILSRAAERWIKTATDA